MRLCHEMMGRIEQPPDFVNRILFSDEAHFALTDLLIIIIAFIGVPKSTLDGSSLLEDLLLF